jgi:hypothetical protein
MYGDILYTEGDSAIAMPSKPPFHRQETPCSCVPACVRMVLASFGRELLEAELRALCDCTPFGTEALNAVDGVRQLGFPATGKYTLWRDERAAQVRQGLYPIVFVNTLPIDGITDGHALMVVGIDQIGIRRTSITSVALPNCVRRGLTGYCLWGSPGPRNGYT